jgi:hypothetical protein
LRGKKRAIGGAEPRPLHLPAQHFELVPKHDQLDVPGPCGAVARHQQLQDRYESEVEEGEEHRAMLAERHSGPLRLDRGFGTLPGSRTSYRRSSRKV